MEENNQRFAAHTAAICRRRRATLFCTKVEIIDKEQITHENTGLGMELTVLIHQTLINHEIVLEEKGSKERIKILVLQSHVHRKYCLLKICILVFLNLFNIGS